MTSGVERLPTGPAETPETRREALLNETVKQLAQQGMAEWREFPAEKRDAGVRAAHTRMLQKLQTLRAAAPGVAQNARNALAPLVNGFEEPDTENRLDAIYDAIEADIPAYGDEPKNHPYLSREEIKPMKEPPGGVIGPEDMLSLYRIDNGSTLRSGQIRADIEFLRGLLKTLPADTAESDAVFNLIVHLEQMRLTDPPNAVAEQMRNLYGGETYMDVAGKEMGRVALTMFLVAGTVIFGTIGLVQFLRKGQVSFAPFMWGIAAWLMADKDLLKSFFGQDAKVMKQFEQINTATTSPVLTDVMNGYGIAGFEWSKTIGLFYEEREEMTKIAAKPDPTDEEVVDAINAISGEAALKPGEVPPPGTKRATLKAMFNKRDERGTSDFQIFANGLLGVEGPDAERFMVDYARNNAFRVGVNLDPTTGKSLQVAADARKAGVTLPVV